jgi:hypothetical protein
LPGTQCHNGGDHFDTEDLRHPGSHVDVDAGQRPFAVVGGGQVGQDVGQLKADITARRPQQHDHRHLVGAQQHFLFEVGLVDLDAGGWGLLQGGQIDGAAGQCGPNRGTWTAHVIKSGTAPSTAFHPVRTAV